MSRGAWCAVLGAMALYIIWAGITSEDSYDFWMTMLKTFGLALILVCAKLSGKKR